ncbi:MAG: hypothetical protein ACRC2K_13270 [Clostridium sp.]
MDKINRFIENNFVTFAKITCFVLTIPLGTVMVLSFKDGDVLQGLTDFFVMISLYLSYNSTKQSFEDREVKLALLKSNSEILKECFDLERQIKHLESELENERIKVSEFERNISKGANN